MRKRYCKGHRRASSFSADPHSPQQENILHHHTVGLLHGFAGPLFWIAAGLCVIAELAILRAAFSPPADAGASAPVPHSPRGTEMIWAVIPAIALAVLLAATWRVVH